MKKIICYPHLSSGAGLEKEIVGGSQYIHVCVCVYIKYRRVWNSTMPAQSIDTQQNIITFLEYS